MALSVQMIKYQNKLINEDIVIPRLVNQQSLNFDQLCEYLADGSTLTAGDISAVMKLIETRLPLILGLNTKVICSSEGLTFRPTVSGSITQSQLKAKLEAKLAEDPSADVDVDRILATSDLSVSDLTAGIAIDLPKKWHERFQTRAEFKRVGKTESESTGTTSSGGTDDTGTNTGGGTGNSNGKSDSGDSIG